MSEGCSGLKYSFLALAAVPVEDTRMQERGMLLFISGFYPSLKTVNPKNGHGNDVLLTGQKS